MQVQLVRSIRFLLFAAAVALWMFVPFQATAVQAAGETGISACGPVVYVNPGDTLSGIASRCGTTVQALQRANPSIGDAHLIFAGQALVVPLAAPGYDVYVVQRGDTMFSIARRHGTTVANLMNLNPGIRNPSWIYVGQVLRVPANGSPVNWLTYQSTRHSYKFRYPANWKLEVSRSSPGLDNERETVTLYQPGYGTPGKFTRIFFHVAQNAYVMQAPKCDSTQVIQGVTACRSSSAGGQNPAQVLTTFAKIRTYYSVQIAYEQAAHVQVYNQILSTFQFTP